MKKFFCLMFTLVILATLPCANAESVGSFDGTWVSETIYYEGIALPADVFGFDMNVTIATTSMGAIVDVYSESMEMNTRDIFETNDGELILEGISRFVYADNEHIHLFMDADGDSTYVVLKRDSEILTDTETATKEYEVSERAKEVVVRGTSDVIVSDWAFIEGDYHNQAIIALTNVSNQIIPELNVQIVFYDEKGDVIGTCNDGHDVILPGSTVVTEKQLYDRERSDYASVEVILKAMNDNSYENHTENLAIKESVTKSGVFLQITNNDKVSIDEVEIAVVYYKNGIPVGADTKEIYNLNSGDTYTLDYYGYKTFGADAHRYFVNQAHTFGF